MSSLLVHYKVFHITQQFGRKNWVDSQHKTHIRMFTVFTTLARKSFTLSIVSSYEPVAVVIFLHHWQQDFWL
jgi:hypothetical protein